MKEKLVICNKAKDCKVYMCEHIEPHLKSSTSFCEEDICGRIKQRVKCIPVVGDWDD